MKTPEWYYDEKQFSGVNFDDPELTGQYDQVHGRFRDFQKEAEQVMAWLDLQPSQTLMDMGAGTGAFTVHAAGRCKKIYAVDVAPAMLKACEEKCRRLQIDNVEFCSGGFLTYEHKAEPVDAIVSQIALHHLPDFWKQAGLFRCFEMVRPGGLFFLRDVVFSFEPSRYMDRISNWVESHSKQVGSRAAVHIRSEYSTMDWVMEGMLRKAGFLIEKAEYRDGFFAQVLCRRPSA